MAFARTGGVSIPEFMCRKSVGPRLPVLRLRIRESSGLQRKLLRKGFQPDETEPGKVSVAVTQSSRFLPEFKTPLVPDSTQFFGTDVQCLPWARKVSAHRGDFRKTDRPSSLLCCCSS